jgi:hypothetical protein
MKNGWQAPLAALVVVILFAAFIAKPMQNAADIAAWVQGVGSLLAIAAAVWIYAKQYADKKADDDAETVAWVQAIRDEVDTVWREYCEVVGASIQGVEEAAIYNMYTPEIASNLIVYPSNPTRIGKINDAALRKLIVTAYTGLRGHFNSLEVNNRLVMDVDQFQRTYWAADRETLRRRSYEILIDYAKALKASDNELKEKVHAMLIGIDAWLASHPAR